MMNMPPPGMEGPDMGPMAQMGAPAGAPSPMLPAGVPAGAPRKRKRKMQLRKKGK